MQYTSYNIQYTCYTIYNDLIHRKNEDGANLATTLVFSTIYNIHYTLYNIQYTLYIIHYTMT